MLKRIMIVLGTRPDAIKLAPVIVALRARPQAFDTVICSTDQHREMLAQALDTFGLTPDVSLNVMQSDQTLPDLTMALLSGLSTAITSIAPDRVMVQGDTTTAFAAALAAYYAKIPVAHVEAGLRSHDRYSPFPEEINRRLISAVTDIHFAPTQVAADALATEGAPPSSIHVTGNTAIDALAMVRARLATTERSRLVSSATLALADGVAPLILVTCHRRESFGDDLAAICHAVARIAAAHPLHRIVFPVHLNPNVRAQVMPLLSGIANVALIEPVSYSDLVLLLSRSVLVLTDSGGLQEEVPSFGLKVLVLRRKTERPEGIAAGIAFLVGADEELIVKRAGELLAQGAAAPRTMVNPYGDGHAAERIVDALANAV